MSHLKKNAQKNAGIEQGFAAFRNEVNIGLFNDIFAFIVKTTAVDALPVIRNLGACHLWYSRSNSGNIQEQFGFRYLGELLERFEDKAETGIADIRAVALAMAWAKALLTDDMFVGDQKADFIKRITAMSAGDTYLQGALYLLDKDGGCGKMLLEELAQGVYTRSEELMFVLSLYDEFGQAFEAFKPQLLELLGQSRSFPVYGNMGLISWLIKRLDTVLKGNRAKDLALFRALSALPVSFVKLGDRHHSVLLENGYTADEILYMNSSVPYFRPVYNTIEIRSIVAEKIAVELCRTFINSDKTHSQETYDYLELLFRNYESFSIKIQGFHGLYEAIRNDIILVNPQTFIWLFRLIDERHHFNFDILDSKWDILSQELNAEEYRRLFDKQLQRHRDETPEQIRARIQRYDSLTGLSYLSAFERKYQYDDDEFALMVEKGIIDLAAALSSCSGLDALNENTSNRDRPPMLIYIRTYVRGMYSREAFDFMKEFFRENDFDEMHRLFRDGSSYSYMKTYFFKDALYEGPRRSYSDGKTRFKLKRPFLSDEEHRELFGWLDDYMFRYEPESYVDFAALMLLDPFVTALYSSDELRQIYDMVRSLKINVVKENAQELKQLFLTEAELQAEKDAETALKIEQQRMAKEQEIQKLRDELEKFYDGSFKSLLKYLDAHDYSFRNSDEATLIASEYLGKTLEGRHNRLTNDELGRFLQFGSKLIKAGVISFALLKNHISIVEEDTDYAANN